MRRFEEGFVYVLSYGWLTAAHPDPFGHRLRVLKRFFDSEPAHAQKYGLFWDFVSVTCLPGPRA